MAFRLRIREQLCLLISLACILAIVVLAVSTWFQSRHYLRQSREELLGTVANVKASQINQNVGLLNDAVQSISTRDMLQQTIHDYNNGNRTEGIIEDMETSLSHALNGGTEQPLLLQAVVYPLQNAVDDGFRPIASVTANSVNGKLQLPYFSPNGSALFLGQGDNGYPPQLFPNFTSIDYADNGTVIIYEDRPLYYNTTVLLGPLVLSANQSLISMTIAINNNTTRGDVLGYLTIVLNASSLYETVESRVGLGETGEVVLIGPTSPDNHLPQAITSQSQDGNVMVEFILPPHNKNHPKRANNTYLAFPLKDYPAAWDAYTETGGSVYDIGTLISTHNEESIHIACGYAKVPSDIVDWILIFEQAHSEVVAPVNNLRNTILICAFSVLAGILIICFPLAHYAVSPIIALRKATRATVVTYESPIDTTDPDVDPEKGEGSLAVTRDVDGARDDKRIRRQKAREFHIPEKVPVKRHFVHDELTDLTSTFNEMTDELSIQYSKLEERVKLRTMELEESRNEAHAANESKTLFIANVSHELRTPLNGVIGMCAVAMQEEDVIRVRQSLKIIYKSSDLLLHLLNDLLTFSSSSYGRNLAIEEDLFRLGDIGTQVISIFEKKATEADISLRVLFVGQENTIPADIDQSIPEDEIVAKVDPKALQRVKTEDYARGPMGTGPLRTMGLRGDKHRILQILMNLVSNSLKFTPEKGAVEVRIKYRDPVDYDAASEISNPNTITPQTQMTADAPGISQNEISYMASSERRQIIWFDFEVEDTGMGVPENLHQEIFKPFVQADAALSKKHGGTGLGLAICSQLAQLMGGTMSVKSTVGIGSTFTLSLPLQYTKEVVPSISGSLRPLSTRAGSLASSRRRDGLSVRSLRSQAFRNGHRSTRTSIYSSERDKNGATRIQSRDVLSQRSVRFDDSKSESMVQDSQRNKQGRYGEHQRLEPIMSISIPHSPSSEENSKRPVSSPSELQKDNEKLSQLLQIPQPTSPRSRPRPPPRSQSSSSPSQQQLRNPWEEPQESKEEAQVEPTPKPKPPTPKIKIATKAGAKAKPKKIDLRRILVAEDNAVNQQVILRLLKLEGVSDITLAEDGLEALNVVKLSMGQHDGNEPVLKSETTTVIEAKGKGKEEDKQDKADETEDENKANRGPGGANQKPISLIFMDVQMPNMDGIESTKQIRAIGFEGPILALTAFDHETNRAACQEAGMNDFLGKPIKRNVLRKALEDFKEGAKERSTETEEVVKEEEVEKGGQVEEGTKSTEQ